MRVHYLATGEQGEVRADSAKLAKSFVLFDGTDHGVWIAHDQLTPESFLATSPSSH